MSSIQTFQDFRPRTALVFAMARFNLLSLLLAGFQLLTFITWVHAQDAPLFIQGGLEDATAVDETYNTGGTISINGFTMTVPKNMLVQFPAAWVPWKDFVADKASMLGYEVNVRKNSLQSSVQPKVNTTQRSLATFSTGNPSQVKSLHTSFLRDSIAVSSSPSTLRTAA